MFPPLTTLFFFSSAKICFPFPINFLRFSSPQQKINFPSPFLISSTKKTKLHFLKISPSPSPFFKFIEVNRIPIVYLL